MEDKRKEYFVDFATKCYKSGLYEKAIQACKKALDIDENYIRAYHGIARSLACLKEYEQSIKMYDIVISALPRNHSLYKQRGDIYYQLGKYNAASNDYRRAIALKYPNKSQIREKAKIDSYIEKQVQEDVTGDIEVENLSREEEPDIYDYLTYEEMSVFHDDLEDGDKEYDEEKEEMFEEYYSYIQDWEDYTGEYK